MAIASPQKIIGLTGGIATGKSTVTNYLAATYSVPILDSDIYAREAVELGTIIWQKIVDRYGPSILLPKGNLNRPLLGEIIFNQPQEKAWLEAQIHPYVRDRLQAEQHSLSQQPALVMAIPLLFEAQMTDLVNQIWVVACPELLQLERLMARDRLSPAQAQARINSQLPLASKITQADVVLDNASSLEALLRQVDQAWHNK
jgi:dephospho-CoA kinase